MISLNAILSEREGPDYLFNRNNQKALRETVSNLRQSCTWHSIDLSALRSSHYNCVQKLKRLDAGTAHMNDDDERDLRQLKQVFELALGDPLFMDMMTKHEVSFVVQGLPTLMKETWGWCVGSRGAYLPVSSDPWDDHCLVSGDIVVDLMHDVTDPRRSNNDLYVYNSKANLLESTVVYEKRKRRELLAASKITKSNSGPTAAKTGRRSTATTTGQDLEQKGIHSEANYSGTPSPPLSSSASASIDTNDNNLGQDESLSLTFYTRGVFNDVRILCSTSSKINYLVDQILSHHSNEKCIIFSQHYNEMQEIYLALQLVKVRVLMYLHTSMVKKGKEMGEILLT